MGAACSDDSDEPEAGSDRAVLPDEVVCNLFFRPNVNIPPIEEAEVRVPRGDRLGGALVEHEIGTMTFNVAYAGDIPDGRTVNANVFGADDALIVSVAYQIGDEFPETWLGGFGFTGLHYAYDGEAGAAVLVRGRGRPAAGAGGRPAMSPPPTWGTCTAPLLPDGGFRRALSVCS